MRNSYIKQAKYALKMRIKNNPSYLTIGREAFVESVFTPTVYDKIKALVCTEKASLPSLEKTPVGLSTNTSKFVIFDTSFTPLKGDQFLWRGQGFEITNVDPYVDFGVLLGYKAPLKKISTDSPVLSYIKDNYDA